MSCNSFCHSICVQPTCFCSTRRSQACRRIPLETCSDTYTIPPKSSQWIQWPEWQGAGSAQPVLTQPRMRSKGVSRRGCSKHPRRTQEEKLRPSWPAQTTVRSQCFGNITCVPRETGTHSHACSEQNLILIVPPRRIPARVLLARTVRCKSVHHNAVQKRGQCMREWGRLGEL